LCYAADYLSAVFFKDASKNSEFAQMQGVEKISPRHTCPQVWWLGIFKYVSKKFFTQRSSWDEMWFFRGFLCYLGIA
jgi:hypothetical protein